jgi:uncharacterized membrane protein
MPFEWVKEPSRAPASAGALDANRPDAPVGELHIWPYRSLSRRGFCIFISATFLLLSLPLLAVVGTAVLWGLLPFLLGALALIWLFIQRSYRDGTVLEKLTLWPNQVRLIRHDPRQTSPREFEANPYWTEVNLHIKGGPVPNYVTLKCEGREVEIGAFLSEPERLALYDDLRGHISHLRAS